MDRLVVDSSVAIKWFVPELYSTEARHILNDYQTGGLSSLAPDLINAEVGNIVWKKHRFQGLAEEDAQKVVDDFRLLTFILTPTADLLDEAYRLAITHQRTVYDALYIALSLREQCHFVTADEKLVNAVNATYPKVVWVANWPCPSKLS
jgi:predicted nucleic acid-binding protein